MPHPAMISEPAKPVFPAVDTGSVNILLAADHERINLQSRLRLSESLQRCSLDETRTALTTLQKLHEQRYALLLLDLGMSDQRGLELLRIVQATHPHTRILVICAFDDLRLALHILRAGAHGYLDQRQVNSAELLTAVQSVLADQHYISDLLCQFVSRPSGYLDAPSSVLSAMERQLFGKTIMGCSLAALAAELNLPEESVIASQARVMEKMRAGYS